MTATLFPISRLWPENKPLAVSVSVMLEGWTADSAPGAGPVVAPLKPGYYDHQARSWGDYGARTGAWRLLEIFDKTETKAVFYVSGLLAQEYPDLIKAISANGHTLGAHGWAQNIIPVYLSREEEENDLTRSCLAIEHACGQRPVGYISPRATPSAHTPELLARLGIRWTADAFDYDLPRILPTSHGPVAAVPFTLEVNDMPICVRYGNPPEVFGQVLRRLIDGWPEIGMPLGTIDITAHAHLFGRPAGLIEMIRAIRMAQESPHCWMTSHEELANLCLKAGT